MRRDTRLRAESPHWATRVCLGVCSSCPAANDVFLCQPAQNFNNFALDCGLAGLNLPAVEIRAVVRDGELEIAHAKPGTRHHDALRTKRLPGFTATLPPPQSRQSSSS